MDIARHSGFEIFLGTVVFQYGRYLVLCGGLYALFWIGLRSWTERRRIHPEGFRREDLYREIRNSFWFCLVTSIPVALVVMPEYRAWTKFYFDPGEYPLIWLPLSFILLVFGQDAYFYWVHRALHTTWLYRRVHSVHHRSLNPSPFSAFAMHPIEGLMLFGFNFAFVLLVPTNFYVFVVYQVVSIALNINGHFGAEFQPESWKTKPGLRHMNRATYHTDHHRYFTVNYGLYFTLWDRWMKTFRENSRRRR